jgi:hypothetical protein
MGVGRSAPQPRHLGTLCGNPRPPRSARLPPTAAILAGYIPGVAAGAADIAARIADEAPLVASCSVLLETRM